MQKRRTKSDRPGPSPWFPNCPESIKQPRNPAFLSAVLDLLGPFQFSSEADALAAGVVTQVNDSAAGVSKELASKLVEWTARAFNEAEYLEEDAPRVTDLKHELRAVYGAAKELSHAIESLGFFGRSEIRRVSETDPKLRRMAKKAQLTKLPQPTGATCSPWQDKLNALAEIVDQAIREWPADVGGNTNLYRQIYGSSKWGVVHDAYFLFEIFRPGTATSTPEGDFSKFVMSICEYATGMEADRFENKLSDTIKNYVPAAKRDQVFEAELDRLTKEALATVGDWPISTLVRFRGQLKEISDQRRPLLQRTWPHWR